MFSGKGRKTKKEHWFLQRGTVLGRYREGHSTTSFPFLGRWPLEIRLHLEMEGGISYGGSREKYFFGKRLSEREIQQLDVDSKIFSYLPEIMRQSPNKSVYCFKER